MANTWSSLFRELYHLFLRYLGVASAGMLAGFVYFILSQNKQLSPNLTFAIALAVGLLGAFVTWNTIGYFLNPKKVAKLAEMQTVRKDLLSPAPKLQLYSQATAVVTVAVTLSCILSNSIDDLAGPTTTSSSSVRNDICQTI